MGIKFKVALKLFANLLNLTAKFIKNQNKISLARSVKIKFVENKFKSICSFQSKYKIRQILLFLYFQKKF